MLVREYLPVLFHDRRNRPFIYNRIEEWGGLMEYVVKVIGNVLGALYQVAGASLVIAVLFMCVYSAAKKQGVRPAVRGWIEEFRTDELFRRQFLLVFYICMMLFRTLFCRPIWGHPLENVLGIWGFHKADGSIYTENIENLILFVPFIPLLFWAREEKENHKKRAIQEVAARSAAVSFGFSLLIELCQLFLKIGTFQLTDLFFNTLGGLLGGILYWGFQRGKKRAGAYIRKLGGWDTEEWTVSEGLLDGLAVKTDQTGSEEPENRMEVNARNEEILDGSWRKTTSAEAEERNLEEQGETAAADTDVRESGGTEGNTVMAECGDSDGAEKRSTAEDMEPLSQEQSQAIEALIREAGQKMLKAKLESGSIHEKEGPANFCTEFDTEIQKFLIQGLGRIIPEAEFFGEEDTEGNQGAAAAGKYTFFIDPIDGTTNFMFHYNHSCVSVGLAHGERMIAGFVYNPYVDEMYAGVRGRGSFLNGRKLEMQERSVEEGIAAFGCARYNEQGVGLLFAAVQELFQKSLSIRSGGSAALDLCRIASGSNVIYLEMKLQPYDYAAASVIVEEAGGVIAQIDGSQITLHSPCSVLAGTRLGCRETREIIDGIRQKGEKHKEPGR